MRVESPVKLILAALLFSACADPSLETAPSSPKAEPKAGAQAAQTYQADVERTQVGWIGRKVTGQHDGTLKLKSGRLLVDSGRIVDGSFELDMTSIANLDIDSEEMRNQLVGHLRSDDFFSVDKYPVSRFVVINVTPIPDAKPGDPNHQVSGELTIKGITHPLAFPAHLAINEDEVRAVADIKVDRTQYDIRYGSGKFFQGLGDKLIYDDFDIQLRLVAPRAKG